MGQKAETRWEQRDKEQREKDDEIIEKQDREIEEGRKIGKEDRRKKIAS